MSFPKPRLGGFRFTVFHYSLRANDPGPVQVLTADLPLRTAPYRSYEGAMHDLQRELRKAVEYWVDYAAQAPQHRPAHEGRISLVISPYGPGYEIDT